MRRLDGFGKGPVAAWTLVAACALSACGNDGPSEVETSPSGGAAGSGVREAPAPRTDFGSAPSIDPTPGIGATVPSTAGPDPAALSKELEPLPRPQLAGLEPDEQRTLTREIVRISGTIGSPSRTRFERARAWGELGMTLHGLGLTADALPCYRNARRLEEHDARWPYLEAHIALEEGRNPEALALLRTTTEHRGNYAPAYILAGELLAGVGRERDAQQLFRKASEVDPGAARAYYGLGRIALAGGRHHDARTYLDRAVELAPGATSVHRLLAQATRALGDTAAADRHAAKSGNAEPRLDDPYMAEVRDLGSGALRYEQRGMELVRAGRFPEAAEAFDDAADSDPGDPDPKFFAAMARLQHGDLDGAERDLRRALERDGTDRRSANALATILEHRGDDAGAIRVYRSSLEVDPDNASAHAGLAACRMRAGDTRGALEHYERAIELRPTHAPARMGRFYARVLLDRFREARAGLAQDLERLPDQPAFAHALARLMASAPDDTVRDGERALHIADELRKHVPSPEVGETLAMAYAELGKFDVATGIQDDVLEVARRTGDDAAVRRMEANLAEYRASRPCREPWPDGDPVFSPARPPLPRPIS